MQEDMTVSFDPILYEPQTTWFQRLFVIYLFSVFLIAIYRAIRIAWGMRKLRKLESGTSSDSGAEFPAHWELCLRDTESFKKFSYLTLLLSLLVLAMGTGDVLLGVATQKVPVIAVSAERMANAITSFSVGIVACIVLYCLAMFFDALLARRMSKRN
jgi:hypothetical protein